MTNSDLGLLDAIRVAKEAERKAEAYYASAARATVNPLGHRLLKHLSGFEHTHYERLVAIERSLAPVAGSVGDGNVQSSASAPSEAVGVPETTPKGAIDIVTMALRLERAAQERYADLAEGTDDPDGREMFQRLATEEHQHTRILTIVHQSLKERGVWDYPVQELQA